MRVLVVNAGSSSLKLRLLDADDSVLRDLNMPVGESGMDTEKLSACLRRWPLPDAVGHRIVHGGRQFDGPVPLDATVERALRDLVALAPLHQPKSLAAYDAVSALLPEIPAVACFDTAFHAALPAAAATYAVPREWRERYGVRRYGFHGLSHRYASRRAASMLGREPETLRIVTCHLGAGASLAAVAGGRSVDTTMGFTPLEGLVMATRSGSVDPGLVLWLQEHECLSAREVAVALERRSGLAALAGTADMREVERRATAGDEAARLAFDVFIHRLVTGIAAMTAAAGGLDALVFTGGIGEHSAGVRRAACERLAWLGVAVDMEANASAQGDVDVTGASAAVRTLVIEAREDIEIARETRGAAVRRPEIQS
ncbi:MAG TPA: acetate/propionate family kinase [Gammaproteobacteria bacterium]|nr:acetate/propionate family kinase [Gammaproteobacteria bacterium]